MISFTETLDREISIRVRPAMQTTKCERCLAGEEGVYRARTDVIDMLVCVACAEEARRLGITVVKNRVMSG